MLPLLEMFAVVDSVFEEDNAFSHEHINHSLGRCYRAWLDARDALDPDFDRQKYRHDMKQKSREKASLTKLGAKKFSPSQAAKGSPTSSMGQPSTSEKKTRKTKSEEKRRVEKSASSARSDGRASNGR